MVPLPICLGTLRVAERKKDNRGKRSAQSGEECGVAARAKSRKKWRRRREGGERGGGGEGSGGRERGEYRRLQLQELKKIPDVIYSSPQVRAVQTTACARANSTQLLGRKKLKDIPAVDLPVVDFLNRF